MTRYCFRIVEHQTHAKLAYAASRRQALTQAINFSHDKSVWIVDEEDRRLALFRFGKQIKQNLSVGANGHQADQSANIALNTSSWLGSR